MRPKGFTYLEIILVIGLIGLILLLSGIGFGSFERLQDKMILDQDIQLIHKTIVEARNLTILDGRKRQILISKDCMYFQTISPGKIETVKVSYHENLKLITNTYYSQKLIFYPEGTVSSGGTITFQNKSGDKKTIVVQIGSGRIYLKEG